MAKNTKNTIRLGLFIILSTLIFIAGIYLIGNKQNLWGSTIRLHTVFANVNGLKPGNNVRYSGIDVGTVSDIIILTDSSLLVEMVINAKVQPFIKQDATASIGSDGLVGNMLVNITPGRNDAAPIQDGNRIQSYSRIEPDDILNTLGNTNENIALIANDLLAITQKINEGEGVIPLLLNDKKVAENFALAIANIKKSTVDLVTATTQINQTIDEVKHGEGLISSLLNDTTVFSKMNKFSNELAGLQFEKVDSLLYDLEESGNSIKNFSRDLNQFMEEIERGKGPLKTLIHDENASQDILLILENLNSSSDLLNENLMAMRKNFLFKKYFRKKDKEARKEKRDSLKNMNLPK